MLAGMGVTFTYRPFKKYEGIYIPAANEEDFSIIGINLNRPIARQRFTATHELWKQMIAKIMRLSKN